MGNALVYDAVEDDECYTFMAQKLHEISEQYKEYKVAILKAKTMSYVGSNNVAIDIVALDTQAPSIDVNQDPLGNDTQTPSIESQPPDVANPRISKYKGRETQEEKDKDSHISENDRYKYRLEKNQRKREYRQRECSVCKDLVITCILAHSTRTRQSDNGSFIGLNMTIHFDMATDRRLFEKK